MKKRIDELTLEEADKICEHNCCAKCPLNKKDDKYYCFWSLIKLGRKFYSPEEVELINEND